MEDEYPNLKIKVTPLNWGPKPLRLPPGWKIVTETIDRDGNVLSSVSSPRMGERVPGTEED
jgi:hypothetical protein